MGGPEIFLSIWFIAACLLSVALILLPGVLIFLTWRNRKRLERDQHLANRERFVETHQADGTPFPPAARGLCDQCEKALEHVYHLPDGTRLCPACFHKVEGYKHAAPTEPRNPETAPRH